MAELSNLRYTFFREHEQRQNYYLWLVPHLTRAMQTFSGTKAQYKECLIAFHNYMVSIDKSIGEFQI